MTVTVLATIVIFVFFLTFFLFINGGKSIDGAGVAGILISLLVTVFALLFCAIAYCLIFHFSTSSLSYAADTNTSTKNLDSTNITLSENGVTIPLENQNQTIPFGAIDIIYDLGEGEQAFVNITTEYDYDLLAAKNKYELHVPKGTEMRQHK